jgi:hypothetical protein
MRRARLSAAVLGALAVAAVPAPAQPAPRAAPVQVFPDGTDLFRALLDSAGVKPVTQREFFHWDRNFANGRMWQGLTDDVIVIVLGSAPGFNRDPAQEAVRVGGAALVASDLPTALGSQNQGQIGHDRVRAAFGSGLGGRQDCPFVVPTPADHAHAPPPDDPLAGLFVGLTRVATNKPAYLTVRYGGEFQYALAVFHRGSHLAHFRPGPWAALPQGAVFAAGGAGPDLNNQTGYRLLAMGDHSVFINQMLLEPETDNLVLAARVVDYLRGPGRRSRCLFVENGQVVDQFDGLRKAFDKANPGFPMPDLGKLQEKFTAIAEGALEDIQRNEVPDRLLDRSVGLPAVARFLLVAAAVYATWYLVRRALGARKPTDAPPPPNVPGAPAGPPGVFDRRQRELVRRDNLYEPVRDLVREFFASVGAGGWPGAPQPRLVVAPVVRRPASLREAVKEFWALAYGPPQEVPAARWRDLEPYLGRLRQAHADGKWRFAAAVAAAGERGA